MNRKSTLFFALLFMTIASNATTRRVLFLGNSYIYTNDLPKLIQQMATSMGDTLIYDANTIGGYTLEGHSTDATSKNKINSQQWDIVILQEQSQRPAFDPSQVATQVYPYARVLDTFIRNNRACTETMFFMTWGYKNGDASNCGVYPPICTYSGMQTRLRESYMQMAQDNKGVVSPVGAAWKQLRDSFPSIDLYNPDNSHPSMSGSYLAACVFYASIFHKSPVTSSFTSGLPAADVNNMKRIAARVTLDSFTKWNQYGNYTYSNFTKIQTGNTVNFTNTSVYATSYAWAFGDGNTSTSTSPTNTYATNGTYQVKMTATNACFSETKIDTVIIGPTNINNILSDNHYITISSSGEGKIVIRNTDNIHNYTIDIYDINGRAIRNYTIGANAILNDELIPGMYVYKVHGSKMNTQTHKVIIK